MEGSLEQRYPRAQPGRPNWIIQKPTDEVLGFRCLEQDGHLGVRREDAESLEPAPARIYVIRRTESEGAVVYILVQPCCQDEVLHLRGIVAP